jgi:PAT family beta-lactamase induction signal transducer AmpG
MNKRLIVVFLLGFSSGLPLALLTSTLQAWFAKAGMPVLVTGFLSLLGLPYIYKILWAPILDRYALSGLGLRRSWIFAMQLCLVLGFNLMAFCTPLYSAKLLTIIAFILAFFSATQDAAIDAQRMEYLPPEEHGLGASFSVFGYRVALLLAGGLSLIIANHWGFAVTYRIMGLLMLVGMLTTLLSQEPQRTSAPIQSNFLSTFVLPLKDLAARPNIVALIFFILLYKCGEAFTSTNSGIVMPFLIQGLGFSLDTIAYINKILGIVAIIAGGLTAGFILLRYSLYRVLFLFGLLQSIGSLLFIALSLVGRNLSLFATAVAVENFTAGLASTALVTLLMRIARQPFIAAQFSLLVAIASLPRVLSGPIAAFIQMHLGWVGLYQVSFLLALGFIPFLRIIKEQTQSSADKGNAVKTDAVLSN